MKVFWSIIAVLFIAAVAVAFIPEKDGGPSLVANSNTQTPTDEVVARPQPNENADVVTNDQADPEADADTPTEPTNRDQGDAVADPTGGDSSAADDADSTGEPTLTDVTTATDGLDDESIDTGVDDMTSPDDEQLVATENATESTNENAAETAPANLLNATIEEQPDGSLLIAGQYTVRGTGEYDDPYTLPWDLLVSLSSVYKPREGQKELPDFIMRMHDKQVKITGYVAFPMVAGEIEELLVMLNQWDGCCVGVPPTVYDSVEVRLVEPITTTGASTSMPYGTVVGRMTIDPYFVNDWLVGLYLMEDAEINLDL